RLDEEPGSRAGRVSAPRRHGYDDTPVRRVEQGPGLEGRNDATQELARLLANPQFLERQEWIPSRRLIDPATAAVADVAFGNLRIDGPGQPASMDVVASRAQVQF